MGWAGQGLQTGMDRPRRVLGSSRVDDSCRPPWWGSRSRCDLTLPCAVRQQLPQLQACWVAPWALNHFVSPNMPRRLALLPTDPAALPPLAGRSCRRATWASAPSTSSRACSRCARPSGRGEWAYWGPEGSTDAGGCCAPRRESRRWRLFFSPLLDGILLLLDVSSGRHSVGSRICNQEPGARALVPRHSCAAHPPTARSLDPPLCPPLRLQQGASGGGAGAGGD